MEIFFDGNPTEYHTNRLVGIDHEGKRIELKYTIDNSIQWRNLPTIIVFDAFDNEVLVDTAQTFVTLKIS